ncbi:TetR/AcrR family transcriptional regulator [Fodinicola acaciae]|uniref:TetR/AcrR family transcriptional regulator n=1 Tax=Fodinicola acaciae TaxID=2681555 RepID=UPI0013D57E4E|nr:helix-turn-helix domain-containing protein [Fodinicola acaciae]
MPQKRKSSADILAAARDCVLAYGAQRTTLTEVARRAGVSRPTVYNHWPDVRALLADLITSEMAAIAAEAAVDVGDNARDRLVRQAVRAAAAAIANPLMTKILDSDPELLLPYVFYRLGASQLALLRALEVDIVAGQIDGSIRDGKPAALARMLLLAAQSTVLSHRVVADQLAAPQLVEEFGRLMDGYLTP